MFPGQSCEQEQKQDLRAEHVASEQETPRAAAFCNRMETGFNFSTNTTCQASLHNKCFYPFKCLFSRRCSRWLLTKHLLSLVLGDIYLTQISRKPAEGGQVRFLAMDFVVFVASLEKLSMWKPCSFERSEFNPPHMSELQQDPALIFFSIVSTQFLPL